MSYTTVIGLEVHLQLRTETKAFCGCSTAFGQKPNSQTCPVCLGLPGSLPVLNEKAFHYAIKVALALGCAIQEVVKFDRKNYYYPDLPKNYQISQYDMPLSYDGRVDVEGEGGATRTIKIKRVHLEEDAGKLVHMEGASFSLVDYNRAGEPLLEIVTEPDIASPQEAFDYLTKLKSILGYLRVSDCDMEKGSLRCDANVSLKLAEAKELGTKVEIKNMNTFKGVRSALEYEIERQTSLLDSGGRIVQETRLWDADKSVTRSMRTKEEAQDYRYFPEPDLVPFVVDRSLVDSIRSTLPEFPDARRARFAGRYGLSAYDASVLTGSIDVAEFFERCLAGYADAKKVANWIMGDIMAMMNERSVDIGGLKVSPEDLVSILKMMDAGTLSGKMAKEVLAESISTGSAPEKIVADRGMTQISNEGELAGVVERVVASNAKSAKDYASGKKNALSFLVGQVMKETKGKANPGLVNALLIKKLGGSA